MPHLPRLLLALVAVAWLGHARASAQQAALPAPSSDAPGEAGGRISGLVEDMLGGALGAARVRATCAGVTRDALTDATGRFVIDRLPRARCEVEASADLFATVSHTVDLDARGDAHVRFVVALATLTSEVTVTPVRGEQERTFDIPEAIGIVTHEELESRQAPLLPQALREETGVLIQQTTTAHASVFIRGFSAQRVVYLLDGVRFNTATYRAGATQYLGWIDPAAVQRVEIVRGPASVQYGSDAMGGAVNVLAQRPEIRRDGRQASGTLELGGATADAGAAAHLSGQVRSAAFALRGGASTRAAGDLRTGGGRDSHSAVTRYLGLPSSLLYDRLPGTGYRQAGWSAAATLPLRDGSAFTALAMQSRQEGVRRYDRQLGGDGLFRSTFDPQRLGFGYLRYQRNGTGPFAALQGTLSLNQQQDDRLEQARPASDVETETARTRVVGYVVQGTLQAWRGHTVTTGADMYDESIATSRQRWHDGVATSLRPEIPDGAGYSSAAAFVQDSASVFGDRLALRAGLRGGTFRYDTRADAALGVRGERVRTSALTFNTGAVWKLTDAVNLTGAVNRGFRAANAFDLGAIGVSGGGFEVAPREALDLRALIGTNDGATAVSSGVPVSQLGPEAMYAVEVGIKLRRHRVAGSLVLFDLELRDAIARRTAIFPPGLAGSAIAGYPVVSQDADGRAYVGADPRPIATRVNIERGRVQGVEADVQVRLGSTWVASANGATASGRDGDDGYLRRMPPTTGVLRLKWEPSVQPLWLEAVVTATARQDRLSPGDLADARIGGRRQRSDIAAFFDGSARDLGLVQDGRVVATGESLAQLQARLLGGAAATHLYPATPGFVTFTARGGWRLSSRLDASLVLDNLTDRNFRWHGSGTDAPGFSLAARLRIRL